MNYQCPRCGGTQTYPDERGGQVETCPTCGNVNRLPGSAPAAPAGAPAAAGPVPGATAPPPPAPVRPPGGPGVPPPAAPMAPDQVRMWAMFCHLAALAPVPMGHVIGPLVVWLIQKDKDPFIDQQGKESLNFQITLLIGVLICVPLFFVIIGFFLVAALGIANLVFVILAAISANKGVPYHYPWSIKFIK